MNAGAKKGLIWGLVLTAVGVGVYLIVKKAKNKGEEDYIPDLSEEDVIVASSGGGSGGGAPAKVELDPFKWLQKGSKNVETKYVQWGINEIIKTAKMMKYWKPSPSNPSKKWYDIMSSKDKARINALAGLTPLKGDGDFGSKTEAAVQVVKGKKGTNYCEIRKTRSALAHKYNFKDPYGGAGCKKRMVTA